MNLRKYAYYALIAVGCMQIIGVAIPKLGAIRSLGMVTAASPLPLVFSVFRGFETFSSKFTVRVKDKQGGTTELELGPENYGKLGGPYNRRNVYGAVVSYGPKLVEEREKKLVYGVLSYGFCNGGPLAKALGLDVPIEHATIHVRNEVTPLEADLEVPCH